MYCDIWYGLDQQILNDVCPLLAEILGPAQSAKDQLLIGSDCLADFLQMKRLIVADHHRLCENYFVKLKVVNYRQYPARNELYVGTVLAYL